jgi:hypothetical protein
LEYAYFANRHDWPPDVVERQPWWAMEQLRILNPLWDEAVAEAREAARQAAG